MSASGDFDRLYTTEIVIEEEKLSQTPWSIEEILLKTSQSVYPECLGIIDGRIFSKNNTVYLRKTCEEHGTFEVPLYSDAKEYLKAVKQNKPGTKPLHYQGSVREGCPRDCGLCEDHRQHTCVGIIEITEKCNLQCPVCFADSKNGVSLPFDRVKRMIDLYVKCEGTPEKTYIALRGRPLLELKLKALFSMSAVLCSDKTEKALDAICGIEVPDIKGLVDNITLISVHTFMDEYSFDLERAKKCCVTEILPNGQMIPFCVYNVMYRKQLTPAFRNLCKR